ncbi:MAG: hypothetical protein KAI29_25325, partial [Cyclobacteriaceae bacterium]|nr:hypothetical protein [Cyclobacteriaceae bacterium]
MKKYEILIITILLFCNLSIAQDTTKIEKDYLSIDDRVHFILSPYAWLAGMSTDVGGEKIRQTFNDVASLTNFGFQLNAIIMYKKWILLADGTNAHLQAGSDEGIIKIDGNIKQYILDLKLGYLVYSNISKAEDNVIRGWALEVNVGAKYWKNDLSIDYAIGDPPIIDGSIKEPQSWWDFMVGAKARFFLSDYVLLGIAGDIGGFGLGNSSKLSYDFS